jgi:hypothetical protein
MECRKRQLSARDSAGHVSFTPRSSRQAGGNCSVEPKGELRTSWEIARTGCVVGDMAWKTRNESARRSKDRFSFAPSLMISPLEAVASDQFFVLFFFMTNDDR